MLGSKFGTLLGAAARRSRSAAWYSGSVSSLTTATPSPPPQTPGAGAGADKVKKEAGPRPQTPPTKRPPQGPRPQGQPRPAAGASAQGPSTQTAGQQQKSETWSSLLGDLKKANASGQNQQQRKPRDQQQYPRQAGQGQGPQQNRPPRPPQQQQQWSRPPAGGQQQAAAGQAGVAAGGQQQAGGERRVYNNRGPQGRRPPRKDGAAIRKPGVPGAAAAGATGAAAGAAVGVAGGLIPPARLFGSKRGADEDEDEGRETDEIPPEIEPYLFDSPFFEEVTRKGQSMDYSDMDPADKFFADVWMESFKSSSHEVTYVMEKEGINRIRIPKPRATVDLLQSLIPDIHTIDQQKDKEAMEVASAAWQALNKNVYFADDDKSYMCNQIARQTKYFLDEAEKLSKSGAADAFLIFNSDFRRGWEGMDEEAQRQLFADFEGSSSAEVAVLGEDGEDVTDYSKTAEVVVDEDQL